MKFKIKTRCIAIALDSTFFALAGCTAMTTLPTEKLTETASAVIGKPVKAVSNVRSVGDTQFFDAQVADGKTYSCSLSVLFGVTSQHQKCDPK
jgi:hypothetical protein